MLIVLLFSFLVGSEQIAKEEIKGVLDRFEDNDKALILIEKINEELIVPKIILPAGSTEGMWFHLEKDDEREFEIISIDNKTTVREKKKVKELMNQVGLKNHGAH